MPLITSSVRIAPNVANLPLRPPAVLARSVASLDILSGGRVELGLGAGAFWDGVAAMGGPRRTPGESVSALEEAISLMRLFFAGALMAFLLPGWWLVTVAQGDPNDTLSALSAIFGLTFIAAVVFLARRG